jgi:alkanesulfonate monooxygenase
VQDGAIAQPLEENSAMNAARRSEKMHLGAFFHATGHHVAAWMHPDAQIDAGTNFRHYVSLAQTAERGKLDFMFLADFLSIRKGRMKALRRWPQYMAHFEPLTLLSGIAAVTEKIGLVATASTTYSEPYDLARKYASLDHISGGRAGWNVVTSAGPLEPGNFGRDGVAEHRLRYERAREFVQVVKGLWDSWEDDAFLRDRESGLYFDPDRLHTLDHQGKFYSVRGPLNLARPPQGHPVLVQAGSSEDGRELAAELVDIVFTGQWTLESAQAFYRDVKTRAEKFGRDPGSVKVLPGINPIVGRTEEEALEKQAFLQSKIHPDVGLELLSNEMGGIDLSGYALDEPLPETILPTDINTSKSVLARVKDMVSQGLTLREMFQRYAGARGHRTVVGTAEQIVDHMEEWFLGFGVDGFLIQPAWLPGGLDDFVGMVVPELRRRGLFREEYEGATLRDHLGLARPANRFSGS